MIEKAFGYYQNLILSTTVVHQVSPSSIRDRNRYGWQHVYLKDGVL